MKIDIRKILRETFIPEAEVNPHTNERIRDRIMAIPDDTISKEKKEEILTTFGKIESIKFSSKKSYVIKLGDFPINRNSRFHTKFKGDDYYKVGKSIGNEFWIIIRNNSIDTFMLATDYQTKNSTKNANRLNVDYSISNIDEYIRVLKNSRNERKSIPIVIINGVKWIVDIDTETIHKKNKPSVKHRIEDIIDNVDDKVIEDIMNFF